MKSNEVMDLLEWTGAIMKGHFKLTSGRHSDTYIEKFRLLENPIALDKICLEMSNEFKNQKINLVVGAAIGGILLSGGVGKHINCKHIFSERIDGEMQFRRGFTIEQNANVLIVEDIVTTGGSILLISTEKVFTCLHDSTSHGNFKSIISPDDLALNCKNKYSKSNIVSLSESMFSVIQSLIT